MKRYKDLDKMTESERAKERLDLTFRYCMRERLREYQAKQKQQ